MRRELSARHSDYLKGLAENRLLRARLKLVPEVTGLVSEALTASTATSMDEATLCKNFLEDVRAKDEELKLLRNKVPSNILTTWY